MISVGALVNVNDGIFGGALPAPGSTPAEEGRVVVAGTWVGGWEVRANAVGAALGATKEAASTALVVRGGSTGHFLSSFHTGKLVEMGSGAEMLQGALVAQGCIFPMGDVKREHRLLLRASSDSAQTSIPRPLRDGDCRSGKVKALDTGDEIGPGSECYAAPLLLHDMSVQDMEGAFGKVCDTLDCDWVMGEVCCGHWRCWVLGVGCWVLGNLSFS